MPKDRSNPTNAYVMKATSWNGDSDMSQYAPLCNEVLKVSNLRKLAEAVDALLAR